MANKSCLSVALQQQQWGALAQKMQMQKSEHKRLYIELVLYHHLIAAERKWFRGDELKCPRMWHHIQYTPYIIPIRAGSEIWLPSFIFPRGLEGSLFFFWFYPTTRFSRCFRHVLRSAINPKENSHVLQQVLILRRQRSLFPGKKCTRRMSLKWRPPLPVGGIRGNMWTYLQSKQKQMCKFSISMFLPQA